MTKAGGIAADHLKSFVERIERLDEEIKALNQDKSEVYSEAKATGFDVKIMRELIKIRRMDKDDLDEHEALLETYMLALGMRGNRPTADRGTQNATRARTEPVVAAPIAVPPVAVPEPAPEPPSIEGFTLDEHPSNPEILGLLFKAGFTRPTPDGLILFPPEQDFAGMIAAIRAVGKKTPQLVDVVVAIIDRLAVGTADAMRDAEIPAIPAESATPAPAATEPAAGAVAAPVVELPDFEAVYDAGYQARANGSGLDANPYPETVGPVSAHATWVQGWRDHEFEEPPTSAKEPAGAEPF